MGIFAFIIFGLIAGALAQMIMPGSDPGGKGFKGIAITIGIGILGSFVGGLFGSHSRCDPLPRNLARDREERFAEHCMNRGPAVHCRSTPSSEHASTP